MVINKVPKEQIYWGGKNKKGERKKKGKKVTWLVVFISYKFSPRFEILQVNDAWVKTIFT